MNLCNGRSMNLINCAILSNTQRTALLSAIPMRWFKIETLRDDIEPL